jgi:hypothetical protein
MTRTSTRLAVRAAFATLLLGLLAPEVLGQPVRPIHRVEIGSDASDGSCTYFIEDQEDQDVFVVASRGAVIFASTSPVDVRISIDEDPVRRVSATGPDRDAILPGGAEGGATRAFAVRGRMGFNTQHQVNIHCCTSRSLLRQCNWQEALPAAISPEPPPADGPRGPNAGSHGAPGPTTPVGPGGPTMRVED